MRLPLILFFGAAVVVSTCVMLKAQSNPDTYPRDAMMLFSYWPKQGQEKAFHDGYKKHLDWHRNNNDSIMWYAWDVVVGRRTGLFIDGAFDIAFAALDNRVKPQEDAADFIANAAAFADINDRVVYKLRMDLSGGTPLEHRKPGRLVVATSYYVRPGHSRTFESVLRSARQNADDALTVYQVVTGNKAPQYLLLEQRASWEDVGAAGTHPLAAWSSSTGPGDLQTSVASVESEVWRYREDLTYFP